MVTSRNTAATPKKIIINTTTGNSPQVERESTIKENVGAEFVAQPGNVLLIFYDTAPSANPTLPDNAVSYAPFGRQFIEVRGNRMFDPINECELTPPLMPTHYVKKTEKYRYAIFDLRTHAYPQPCSGQTFAPFFADIPPKIIVEDEFGLGGMNSDQ